MKGNRWAPAARYFLAAVLLATGLGKLIDVPGFARIVASYEVLPVSLTLPAAGVLTFTELALAVWLASGLRQRTAAAASAMLHVVYAAWSGAALWRGLEIANCGCFGVFLARPLSLVTLAEDGVLAAVSLVAMQGRRR